MLQETGHLVCKTGGGSKEGDELQLQNKRYGYVMVDVTPYSRNKIKISNNYSLNQSVVNKYNTVYSFEYIISITINCNHDPLEDISFSLHNIALQTNPCIFIRHIPHHRFTKHQ
jgi:hypothetical protein